MPTRLTFSEYSIAGLHGFALRTIWARVRFNAFAGSVGRWLASLAAHAYARRELVGDFDPTMAPLLLSYGKALYELALSQQGVMGREEVAKSTNPASEPAAPGAKGNFVFEGDGDDGDEEEQEGEGEGEGEQEGDDKGQQAEGEEEPEDDFNAAWEVLDVARTIYAREVENLPAGEGKETRLLLSECYLALGDVSCETGEYRQFHAESWSIPNFQLTPQRTSTRR